MLNLPTTADTIADRTIRLAITLARTTTAAVIPATIARGTGTIGPVGTATDGRAITGQAGTVTGLSARPVVFSLRSQNRSHWPLRATPDRAAWMRSCAMRCFYVSTPFSFLRCEFVNGQERLPLLSHFNQLHERVDSYLL
jgi:hypothetical protein